MAGAGRLERLSRLYSGTAIFFLNIVILFVALNVLAFIGIRVYNRFFFVDTALGKYSEDKLRKAYPEWKWDDLQDLLCCSLAYDYDPYTGFRNMPERRRFVTVDVNGFRHVANQGPWPPSNDFVNVFFFGGSTSFGSGVRDEDTVASHLQAALNERIAGDRVRVYNFGRIAYISLQERALLEWLILQGHVPDFAVFLDGINDFHRNDGVPAMTKDIKELMLRQESVRSKDRLQLILTPLKRLPIVSFADILRDAQVGPAVIDRLSPEELRKMYDVPQLKDAAERYLLNQHMIRLIAASEGVQPLFAIQPIPTYHYDITQHVYGEGSLAYFHEANFAGFGYRYLAERRAELEAQPDFLWLADMQEGRKENLYVSSIHYNTRFAKEIAGRFADRLTPWVTEKLAKRSAGG